MTSFGEYKARMQRLTSTEYSWGSAYSGHMQPQVTKLTLTIPHDFNLATSKRSNYHKKVLDPMKKARQEEREREEAHALERKKVQCWAISHISVVYKKSKYDIF